MTTNPVYANGRTIIHAGDGNEHVSAPPDVCKTPAPGGPLPTPYVNVGKSSDLDKGTKRTKIGGKSVAIVGAELRTSTGDEPGTGGGLVSGKTKGKVGWPVGSPNVHFEGKSVVRFLDTSLHNGNTYNTAFQLKGGTGIAYGDDFDGNCPICDEGPEKHRILELPSSVDLCDRLHRALHDARGPKAKLVVTRRRGAGYMVAVMVCKCGTSFAAMSGRDTLAGFESIAAGVVDVVCPGGMATAQELWSANRGSAPVPAALLGTWDDIADRVSDRDRPSVGYALPGNCAAAKLLARAGGHIPVSMTERFFAPKQPWGSTYHLRQTTIEQAELAQMTVTELGKVFANMRVNPDLMTRSFESRQQTTETVASCNTCQALLYMAMCGKDDRAC